MSDGKQRRKEGRKDAAFTRRQEESGMKGDTQGAREEGRN